MDPPDRLPAVVVVVLTALVVAAAVIVATEPLRDILDWLTIDMFTD